MNSNSHQAELRSRWALQGTIPLSGVAEDAAWHRARSVATGDIVTLFVVRGPTAPETADAVRRAYLVEDPHLMPVREVYVFDDPRDTADPAAAPGHAADAESPMTVVEYPMPTAPPLAALLGQGTLHPETARAIIGEAASGLDVARRRGLRHQFLDSNRVFVDTASGEVTVLGVGVEAASHPGLDRSREIASFQDTAALVALLYRAISGRSPRPDDDGTVPRPSTIAADPVPEDLDLLCDLVLNQSAHDIPETTRGLIEALEPWQSIPVTLQAYAHHAEPETPPAPVREATTREEDPDTSVPTTAELAAPAGPSRSPGDGTGDLEDTIGRPPQPTEVAADASEAAAAAGTATSGSAGGTVPMPSSEAPDGSEGSEPAAEDPGSVARNSQEAQTIVRDLQLDQKRSSTAFPGHLDVTVPRRAPAMPEPGTGAASGIAVAGGAVATAPGARTPSPELPSRRTATRWPLSSTDAASTSDDAPGTPSPSEPDTGPTPATSTPPEPADHDTADEEPTGPVAVPGRTDTGTEQQGGPILVAGRDRSALAEEPADATQARTGSTLLRDVVSVAVDSDEASTFAMGPEQPAARSRQSQWIIVGGVLLVIVALVFALSTITSGLRERISNPLNTAPVAAPTETTAEPEPTTEETEEPTQEEPELPAAELAGVELFTQGSDEEPDNADQMDRITDGDPGTFWSTQYYTTPDYGGLKEGVGVRIDLAEQSRLSAVVVTTARNTGGTLELRTVADDGSAGDVVATGEFAGDGEVRLEPEEPLEGQSAALYLSELPPDSEESGHFRGRIAEISVE